MRCGFVTDDTTCPRPPEEGRRIAISPCDFVEVLLCPVHALMFDKAKAK